MVLVNPDLTPRQVEGRLKGYLAERTPSARLASSLTQMSGGQEAYLYKFALAQDPGHSPTPMVLRLYPRRYGARRAMWDLVVQNALADAGCPVPRVHLACTDVEVLGGSFVVMDFVEGSPPDLNDHGLPGTLGRAHAELHGVDASPVEEALAGAGIRESRYRFGGNLDWLRERAEGDLPWLREPVRWLDAYRPPEPGRLSIVHGDFHPMNLLLKDGRVTAILDWSNFRLGDPAMDVGFTLFLLRVTGGAFMGVSGLDRAYLAGYGGVMPVPEANLPYYIAVRCVMALQEGADGQAVWRTPVFVERIIGELHRVTGVRVESVCWS